MPNGHIGGSKRSPPEGPREPIASAMQANVRRRDLFRLGVTQRELAARVGVHPNSIARQERGELGIKEPLARLIRLLADQAPRRKSRGGS